MAARLTAGAGRWRVRAGAALALLACWALQLPHLAVVPRAHEDEAWIAAVSWKLATTSILGSDMHGDYSGAAEHYFGFMPLYSVVQAVLFRAAGLGLWQARLTSVYLGLVAGALTFALGRRLFGARVGLLALAGLLLTRTAGSTEYLTTGIVWADVARLARYDIAVPVLGLAAALAATRAEGRRAGGWAALAGALGALAGLAHVYGWFWLVALAAALAHTGRRPGAFRALAALALGAGLVLAPYAAYVLAHWADWAGQMSVNADRMALLEPGWYARNLWAEGRRYAPGLELTEARTWLRPGLWLAAAVGPAAAVALAGRAGRGLRAAVFAWALVLLPALLALLMTPKVVNYLVVFWPLAALAVAWGLVAVWRAAQAQRRRWLQLLLVLACAAVALEGAGQWRGHWAAAARLTPYATYAARLRAAVDAAAPGPATAVLGLHTYWFGFSDRPYTTWYYLAVLARTPPIDLAAALARLAPDIVLVDARMRTYLDAPAASDTLAAAVNAWLAADYAPVSAVDDITYGRTEIYRRAGDAGP